VKASVNLLRGRDLSNSAVCDWLGRLWGDSKLLGPFHNSTPAPSVRGDILGEVTTSFIQAL
jgi:hypothetical protein